PSYAARGPPGVSFRIVNDTALIATRSGSACRSRRRTKRPIRAAAPTSSLFLQPPALDVPGEALPGVGLPALQRILPRVDVRAVVEPDDHVRVVEQLQRGRVGLLSLLLVERRPGGVDRRVDLWVLDTGVVLPSAVGL